MHRQLAIVSIILPPISDRQPTGVDQISQWTQSSKHPGLWFRKDELHRWKLSCFQLWVELDELVGAELSLRLSWLAVAAQLSDSTGRNAGSADPGQSNTPSSPPTTTFIQSSFGKLYCWRALNRIQIPLRNLPKQRSEKVLSVHPMLQAGCGSCIIIWKLMQSVEAWSEAVLARSLRPHFSWSLSS